MLLEIDGWAITANFEKKRAFEKRLEALQIELDLTPLEVGDSSQSRSIASLITCSPLKVRILLMEAMASALKHGLGN